MLNKKYYKQILLPVFSVASILLLLATIIGCSKEMETADTLEVSKENPVVKADGGSISIDVSSNTSWKVGKIESSWLRIENTAGTGTDSYVCRMMKMMLSIREPRSFLL